MSLKGTTYKRCGCKDPSTGKPLNQHCPQLPKRRHGTWMFATRIDTTKVAARRLKRGGYATETAAANALDQVRDIVKLAGADNRLLRRIGDMIFEKTKRGGQLPAVDDVKRRLGSAATWAAVRRSARRGRHGWRESARPGRPMRAALSRSAGTGCCRFFRTWPWTG